MAERKRLNETDPSPNPAARQEAEDAARSGRVEDAIYKRARGYKVSVRKTYKVKRVEYDPQTGKKTCEREELQAGTDEVVVPADVRACAYWLVNRSPARWQEHPAAEAAVEAALGGTVELPPLKEPDTSGLLQEDGAGGEGEL